MCQSSLIEQLVGLKLLISTCLLATLFLMKLLWGLKVSKQKSKTNGCQTFLVFLIFGTLKKSHQSFVFLETFHFVMLFRVLG